MHQSIPMETYELFDLLDAAGDATFAVDRDGCICYWSANAEELLGFSKVQVVSKNCSEILAVTDDAGCNVCLDCQILKLGRKQRPAGACDLQCVTASGDRRWLSISTIVAHVKQGPTPMVINLMRDIEERKRVEFVTREIMVRVGDLTGHQADQRLGRRPDQQPPVALSPRELSILEQLSLGQNTQQIATEFYISATTVRNHVQHILTKTRCHSRLEAVVVGARQGLI